jgi:hypothetical protein
MAHEPHRTTAKKTPRDHHEAANHYEAGNHEEARQHSAKAHEHSTHAHQIPRETWNLPAKCVEEQQAARASAHRTCSLRCAPHCVNTNAL